MTPTPHTRLPRVLIDGMGDVWVRDREPERDRYTLDFDPDEHATYAQIEAAYGVSTWLMSQKSVPS